MKINERSGDRNTRIVIPHSRGDRVSILYAYIKDRNGVVVRRLRRNEITTRSHIDDISLYQDRLVKIFELKHNTHPYTIHYAVRVTTPRFFNVTMFSLLYARSPVRDGRIVVETTTDRPIRYRQQHLTDPKRVENNGRISYTWAYNFDSPQRIAEVNADYSAAEIPQLIVTPLNFRYGVDGSWESWETFGNWVFRLNQGRNILPESGRKKARQLTAGVSDNKQKAAILFRYLQQTTRYINVTIDVGGFQTFPASYVYRNRYGDCKALSNYMQALLNEVGIPSYFTLIYAGDPLFEVDENFPAQVFNHAILTIPFEDDTVFLETTDQNIPFGYIPTSLQGKKALIIIENDSRLITLPTKSPDEVLCSRHIHVKNDTVRLHSIQRGANYERFNFILANINRATIDRYIRNTILPFGTFHLVEHNFYTNPDSTQIGLSAELRMENVIRRQGNSVILEPFPISLPAYESPTNRNLPVFLNLPTFHKDTIVYELPGNIARIPENVQTKTRFGHYTLAFEHLENTLTVYKTLLIYAGRYTEVDYEEFHTFIQTVFNHENRRLHISIR
jgi:hypothetical protein